MANSMYPKKIYYLITTEIFVTDSDLSENITDEKEEVIIYVPVSSANVRLVSRPVFTETESIKK